MCAVFIVPAGLLVARGKATVRFGVITDVFGLKVSPLSLHIRAGLSQLWGGVPFIRNGSLGKYSIVTGSRCTCPPVLVEPVIEQLQYDQADWQGPAAGRARRR